MIHQEPISYLLLVTIPGAVWEIAKLFRIEYLKGVKYQLKIFLISRPENNLFAYTEYIGGIIQYLGRKQKKSSSKIDISVKKLWKLKIPKSELKISCQCTFKIVILIYAWPQCPSAPTPKCMNDRIRGSPVHMLYFSRKGQPLKNRLFCSQK